MYFSLHYVIFTLKKIASVKQCRISPSADRWQYLIVSLVLIEDFLTAKHVYRIHGCALQTFISVFSVLNTTFQDLCFFHKDPNRLCGFMSFLSLSCGDRALPCFMLCKQMSQTHLSSKQGVELWGQTQKSWELLILWTTSRTWHSRTGHLTMKETLFWKWVVD